MGKVTDKDKGWRRLQALAKSLAADDVHVRVGVLDDGRAGSEVRDGITNGQLAVAMEFGTAHIPARSWVGLTFDKARGEVQSDMQRLLGHIVDGKITVDKALNVLGAKYSAAVKTPLRKVSRSNLRTHRARLRANWQRLAREQPTESARSLTPGAWWAR